MPHGLRNSKTKLLRGLRQGGLRGINLKAQRKMRIVLERGDLPSKFVYVSNVIGSSGRTCKCGCTSWAAHWHRGTGRILGRQKCYVRGCGKPATVGAHVHVQGHGSKQMILPFCSFHNARALTIALALKRNSLVRDAVPAYTLL